MMRQPETDKEGYLTNPDDWTPQWAEQTAQALAIELTEEHWAAIGFMREFLALHHVAPDARFVMRFLAQTRAAPRNRLFELFPYGYPGQACKIAGMRRPRTWSTG
ncbi:MAG: TusE/DsrC/DsvC family sulfur relay protein [Hyphomicrobiales bacterium]|nr:TusE/DsrC/DsvC family sulfur relay protein [Hyphomicrobiales bacterium]